MAGMCTCATVYATVVANDASSAKLSKRERERERERKSATSSGCLALYLMYLIHACEIVSITAEGLGEPWGGREEGKGAHGQIGLGVSEFAVLGLLILSP